MTRETLGIIVRGMWLLLVLGFLAILFASLNTGGDTGRPHLADAEIFSDVAEGQTAMRRYQGQRVWVTRFGAELLRQHKTLEPALKDPASGCALDRGLCVLKASGLRDGIEIAFSASAPPTLPANLAWHGGFVDPADGSVYDRLGRAYLSTASNQGRSHLVIVPVELPGLEPQ